MVSVKSTLELLEDIKKKNLTVVAVQQEEGISIFWLTNSYGDMWFVQVNSK